MIIFISHAGEDTWVARQIARHVERSGAIPFLDEADVDVGDLYEEKLLRGLDEASELLVLLTPWSVTRPYLWAELGAAWMRRIPIVVALHGISIGQFQSHPRAPNFIKSRDMIPLNEIDRYFDQLRLRIGGEAANVRRDQ